MRVDFGGSDISQIFLRLDTKIKGVNMVSC